MKRVHVDPGICGFECTIEAIRKDKLVVELKIESECAMIKKLASQVREVNLIDVVGKPHGQNVLVMASARCKLHASCPIPTACIKAAEAELEMALPRNVTITFEET